jgi:Acetyltransferase (GNAT) domain
LSNEGDTGRYGDGTLAGMELLRDDGYRVSDQADQLDRERVWRWLSENAYWALGRERAVQDAANDNSFCVGLYAPTGEQVGFCRIVTDYVTFGWLCDVYVEHGHRGGLGTFMVQFAVDHPAIAKVHRQFLVSRNAHSLYERLGFARFSPEDAPRWMLRNS